MNGRRHQFLARARLAADQDRRAGRGDLVDAEVDLAHAMRIADDVFRAEAFLQGVTEPQVFRLQHLPLRLFQSPRLDVIGDHAGHDFQEPAALLEQISIVQRHVNRKRAHDFLAERDRHAEKGHVGVGFRLSLVKPVREAGFLENLGDDGRLAGLDHLADDAFAILVAVLDLAVAGNARRGGHDQFAAVGGKEHHGAANQRQPLVKQLKTSASICRWPCWVASRRAISARTRKVLLVRADGTETVLRQEPSRRVVTFIIAYG